MNTREGIKNRKASLNDRQAIRQSLLEQEALEIERKISSGIMPTEEPPTPAEMAEAESPRLTDPRQALPQNVPVQKPPQVPQNTAPPAQNAPQPLPLLHVVDNAYQFFLKKGNGAHVAAELTNAYALLELAVVVKNR